MLKGKCKRVQRIFAKNLRFSDKNLYQYFQDKTSKLLYEIVYN